AARHAAPAAAAPDPVGQPRDGWPAGAGAQRRAGRAQHDAARPLPAERAYLRSRPGPAYLLDRAADGPGGAWRGLRLLARRAAAVADNGLSYNHAGPNGARAGDPLRARLAIPDRRVVEPAAAWRGAPDVCAAAGADLCAHFAALLRHSRAFGARPGVGPGAQLADLLGRRARKVAEAALSA